MISSERDQRQTHLIHLPAQLLGLIVLSWACADIRATACVTHEDLPITEPAVESRPLNMAPVLALDLDEVLGSFVSPLCDYHNEKYGTSLKVSDFHSYVFSQVWGGDDKEAVKKVHEFFRTDYFKNMPVVPGAQQAVAKLREMGFDLVVVTSRQLVIEKDTREWLARNFPASAFRDIAFGNHWGLEGRKIRKVDLCRELGAVMLIDDSLAYAEEIASAGMQALLFDLNGEYPWNSVKGELPSGITRVTSWSGVLEYVKNMSVMPLRREQTPISVVG